jgi:hypothetical protein
MVVALAAKARRERGFRAVTPREAPPANGRQRTDAEDTLKRLLGMNQPRRPGAPARKTYFYESRFWIVLVCRLCLCTLCLVRLCERRMFGVGVILSLASPAADSGALRVAYLLMLHLNFLELVVVGQKVKLLSH